jgi:hypothetical protein
MHKKGKEEHIGSYICDKDNKSHGCNSASAPKYIYNYMQQSLSWQPQGFSAHQKILALYETWWLITVFIRPHHLVPVSSQVNPVHVPPTPPTYMRSTV